MTAGATTTAATTTARSSLRAAPRSAAVESFLRNFECERARLPEVLEIALCYGVFCIAQNFSLKGMRVEELRAITTYDTIKKRDFFVRNAGARARARDGRAASLSRASPPPPPPLSPSALPSSTEPLVHVKPSHSWRDGNNDAEILEPPSVLRKAHESEEASARSASASMHEWLIGGSNQETAHVESSKPALDALDVFADVLGQAFIDSAWTAFASRSSTELATLAALDRCFVRVDQRKAAAMVPAPMLPVASFRAFVIEYVKRCVAHHESLGSSSSSRSDSRRAEEAPTGVNATDATDDGLLRRRHSAARAPARSESTARPLATQRAGEPSAHTLHRARTPVSSRRATNAETAASAHRLPKALAHVESKLKPALDARRAKLLRVQKTQAQVLKERLARARLDEYEAKRMLGAAVAGGGSGGGGGSRSPVSARTTRKVPLSDIPTGAAALEIADGFMKSPLLDSFSGDKENATSASIGTNEAQPLPSRSRGERDPLQEELYGAAALDDAFLGCSVPPASSAQRAPRGTTRPTRNYAGWLGDFGPLHTKTVVSEWGTPDESDGDDASDGGERSAMHRGSGQRRYDARGPSDRGRSAGPGSSTAFEWTFDRPTAAAPDASRSHRGSHRGSTRHTLRNGNDGNTSSRHSHMTTKDHHHHQHQQQPRRHPDTRDDSHDDYDDADADAASDGSASCVSDPVFQWLQRAV